MKNLELKQQLIFCEKYRINPNELLLLEILLIAQEGDEPEIVHTYFSSKKCAHGDIIEHLKSLQNVGIINKSYKIPEKGAVFKPENVPLNKTIVKDFYKCSFELGKELWEAYPQFGIINGCQVGLKSVSKKFDTIEDCFRYYGKVIRWKSEIHNHIIELVKWANENNILCTTFCNFIIDHKWEELESLKNGDTGGTNFDAIKVV